MASIQLTPNELEKITGPLVLAYLLNWGFFGVLSMQVYMYHLAFPNDRISNKTLVYVIYVMDAAQTFILTRSAFVTFASGFGDLEAVDGVNVIWVSDILIGLIAFLVQAFYAYRIAVLSQKKHIPAFIILLAFLSLGGSITAAVQTVIVGVFSRLLTRQTLIAAGIWGGGNAACDLLIAASMIYYLKRHDSNFSQTHALLTRIIRLTIETGSATAAIGILSVILVFLPSHPTYYQTSVTVVGKLYANSMMASFNSRMKIGPSNDSPISSSCDLRSAMKFYVATERPGVDLELGCSSGNGAQKIGAEISFPSLSEIPPGTEHSHEIFNGGYKYRGKGGLAQDHGEPINSDIT